MRTRQITICILVVVTAIAGIGLWFLLDREPEYRGRPFSYWKDQLLTGQFQDGAEETLKALKALAPRSAPVFVRCMVVTDTPFRGYYAGLRSKLPASLNALLPRQRLKAPEARNNAFSALCYMGPAAKAQVPALMRLLKHPDKEVRVHAVLVLACIGTDAKEAIPMLQEAALDPNLSGFAAEALRRIGAKAPTQPVQVGTAPTPLSSSDVVTIPGTWGWSVRSNQLGGPRPDFWWQRVRDQGYLTPTNGTLAVVLGPVRFEGVDPALIQRNSLTNAPIPSEVLQPGWVLGFRTADGTVGKLQVIGYRALHDFSFPEASVFDESWKSLVLQGPDNERYHLQVRCVLF